MLEVLICKANCSQHLMLSKINGINQIFYDQNAKYILIIKC